MRPSSRYAVFLLLTAIAYAVAFLHGISARTCTVAREEQRRLTASLALTDLCIATEASYTRHPSVSDTFVPFQDHPGAIEHFPSGSAIGAPPHLVADAPAR